MINIIQKNEILVRYSHGTPIREIAREMGIARNTVRNYIREAESIKKELDNASTKSQIEYLQTELCKKPRKKQAIYKKRAFTPQVEKRFYEIIQKSEERDIILGVNKQYLTATKIHQVLRAEGFEIGKTTITEEYSKYKKKQAECYIMQEYSYGERAEYDFHQIKVAIDGKIVVYHQATISCPKSNFIFGKLYKNETINSVMDSIICFIEKCDGVFKEMVFDNMSTVVKRFVIKGEKQYTDDIIKLSNYYKFKIKTCNARSGNEKGHVENSGKTVRKDLFSLNYQFASEEELMKYYDDELSKYNNQHSRNFDIEKQHLIKKPLHKYLQCDLISCKVNSYSLVGISRNHYSVPDKYVGEEIYAHIYSDKITFYSKNNIFLCEHIKKTGSQEYSMHLDHYINTLLRKPGALANSLVFQQQSEELKLIYNMYYSTKPKKFLEDYSKDPINLTKMIKQDNINENIENKSEIEILSIKQLDDYTLTLN